MTFIKTKPTNLKLHPKLRAKASDEADMGLLFVFKINWNSNYANGNLESDLVKLGKEIQLALNKLIMLRIKNPEVNGVLIEDKIKR